MSNIGARKLENVRSRIEEADLASGDREMIEQFDEELETRDCSVRQQANHLSYILLVAKHRTPEGYPPNIDRTDVGEDDLEDLDLSQYHFTPLEAILTDKEAAKTINKWIDNRKTADGAEMATKTKVHYRTAVRVFGREMTDYGPRGNNVPPSVNYIPGGDPRDKKEIDPTPKPGEILYWDPHMIKIIDEGCLNRRDKAVNAVGWDLLGRPEDFITRTWGDLHYDGDFYTLTVGSKDHLEEDVTLYVATPYLKDWLETPPEQGGHPANGTEEGFQPDTPLFTKLNTDEVEPMGYMNASDQVKNIRDRIDLSRPYTLRWLRKSRASTLAMRDNMNQTKLENRGRWERGSKVVARYIARFNEETDEDVGEGDGIPEEHLNQTREERSDPAPVLCPNCDEWTPRHYDQCMFCTTELVIEDAETVEPEVKRQEDVEEKKRRDRLMRDVAEDEASPDELEIGVEFGDLLHNNPEIAEKAKEFRDALDGSDGD